MATLVELSVVDPYGNLMTSVYDELGRIVNRIVAIGGIPASGTWSSVGMMNILQTTYTSRGMN